MAFERISLNIIPDGEMPVFHVSQFDAGRPIIIDLYNGDDAYTPAAGVTFELHCRKVDDNIVTLDTYEVDGNTITFASTEQLCACSGDNLCEVAIMLDDLLMGTLNFILHVERDPLAGGLTSETSIYNLTQQIDDIISGEGYVKDTDLEILQSDWNETDVTSPAYIKNKPGPALADQADWTETDPLKQSYIKHKPTLATVATSGDYDDLTNKPTIPAAQVQSDWNEADNTKVDYIKNKPDLSIYAQSSDLAAVATSGDYDDLLNKPAIPAAQVNSDWNSNSGVSQILNKPYVPVYTENETPYQIRTAPAGNNRTLEKLIGVSCAFNQLANVVTSTNSYDNNNITITRNGDTGEVRYQSNGSNASLDGGNVVSSMQWLSGYADNHKYLVTLGNSTVNNGLKYKIYVNSTSGWTGAVSIFYNPVPTNESRIFVLPSGCTYLNWYFNLAANTVVDLTFIPQIFDLTAMFGSEVADYLYTLESNTAGSGIALFRQLFPEDYYAYQTATLISSKPVSKVIKDSNDQTIATYPLGSDEIRGLLKVENGQLVAYGDVKGSDGIIYRYFEERAYARGDESLPNAITDGTNTVVELATPTTSSGTPFTNPMLCGSTEEFTDSRSVKMFCGHDSLYYNSPFKGW